MPTGPPTLATPAPVKQKYLFYWHWLSPVAGCDMFRRCQPLAFSYWRL